MACFGQSHLFHSLKQKMFLISVTSWTFHDIILIMNEIELSLRNIAIISGIKFSTSFSLSQNCLNGFYTLQS